MYMYNYTHIGDHQYIGGCGCKYWQSLYSGRCKLHVFKNMDMYMYTYRKTCMYIYLYLNIRIHYQ
jgi:hypothetical protein